MYWDLQHSTILTYGGYSITIVESRTKALKIIVQMDPLYQTHPIATCWLQYKISINKGVCLSVDALYVGILLLN